MRHLFDELEIDEPAYPDAQLLAAHGLRSDCLAHALQRSRFALKCEEEGKDALPDRVKKGFAEHTQTMSRLPLTGQDDSHQTIVGLGGGGRERSLIGTIALEQGSVYGQTEAFRSEG